jgi:hypothetical protein
MGQKETFVHIRSPAMLFRLSQVKNRRIVTFVWQSDIPVINPTSTVIPSLILYLMKVLFVIWMLIGSGMTNIVLIETHCATNTLTIVPAIFLVGWWVSWWYLFSYLTSPRALEGLSTTYATVSRTALNRACGSRVTITFYLYFYNNQTSTIPIIIWTQQQ